MPVAKASISNAETLETWVFQFNPVAVPRSVTANYNEHEVPGLDHAPLQYKNTSNRRLSITIFADDVLARPNTNEVEVDAFLQELTVPRVDESGLYDLAPPLALFNFPNLITMEGFLTNHKGNFKPREESALYGRMGKYTAQIEIVEARVLRASSQDLRAERPYVFQYRGINELDLALGRG